MIKRNLEIRKEKGKIPTWIIAEKMGIHEKTLYAWLRFDLSQERKEAVLTAIREAKEENNVQ